MAEWQEQVLSLPEEMDLDKICRSGQVFRARAVDRGYGFLSGARALYIEPLEGLSCRILCRPGEWESYWHPYFDLDRAYEPLRLAWRERGSWLAQALDMGRGLRLLRQDPWEMLLSFILSQRKSIPAIRSSVEKLCGLLGEAVDTPWGQSHDFPQPEAIAACSLEDLASCGLGYRTAYVKAAGQRLCRDPEFWASLASLGDEELLESLQSFPGVGLKVANCVSLFGFGRLDSVPVDVWIARAMELSGEPIFEPGEALGGILQQYVFFYMIHGVKAQGRKG